MHKSILIKTRKSNENTVRSETDKLLIEQQTFSKSFFCSNVKNRGGCFTNESKNVHAVLSLSF